MPQLQYVICPFLTDCLNSQKQTTDFYSYLIGTWKRNLEWREFGGSYAHLKTSNTICKAQYEGIHFISRDQIEEISKVDTDPGSRLPCKSASRILTAVLGGPSGVLAGRLTVTNTATI